jgi:hypothetical protein
MRKNDETRRGGNLGRAPKCVCSPADTRKISSDQSKGQDFVQQSKIAPLWPDGNWNRPRSASTLIVERVPSHSGRVS